MIPLTMVSIQDEILKQNAQICKINLKSKEYFQSEGIIGRVFARLLKKRLAKDKNLQKAVDKMDKSSEDLKKSIQSAQKDGVKIPDELLVYAGLKKAR